MRRIAIALALSVLIACQKKEEPATETIEAAPPPVTTTTAAATQTTAPPQAVVHIPADVPIPKDGVALWLNADNIVRIPAEWGTNAPMPMPNVLNGHAVLRFDGTDDMIKTDADIHPGRAPNVTVFAVFNSATAEPSPLRKLYGNDDGGFDRAVGLDDRAADANYAFFAGGSGAIAYFPLKAGQFYITADQFTATGFSGWVDGAKTATAMAEWGPDALPNLYVGNTGTSFSEFWQGDLAEMIVYVRALSDAERVQVEDYLAGKYGLTLKRQ
jgi:hypothetical protein